MLRVWITATLLAHGQCCFGEQFDWQYHARRLTGFSKATQAQSLAALKRAKGLEADLKASLDTTDRYLALDVVAALSMEGLLPALLERTGQDESGAIHLTINTLLNSSSAARITAHYENALGKIHASALSTPALMAVLDVMGRLGRPIRSHLLETLMQSTEPEVRSAVVYYIRLMSRAKGKLLYNKLLRLAAQDRTQLIRQQVLSLEEELGTPIAVLGFWDRAKRWLWTPPRPLPPKPPAPPVDFLAPLGPEASPTNPVCAAAYHRLQNRGQLYIRIVFGYKDTLPARFVGDRYEAATVASYLTAPCVEGWWACGFRRNPEEAELFHKTTQTPTGESIPVTVRLTHSSAGPDDQENRKDRFQRWRSRHATAAFLSGVRDADVLFYNGHSRDGGGPDFNPPRMTADGSVDYDWYTKHKVSTRTLLDTMEGPVQLKLLGLFSCTSTGHFRSAISRVQPDLALITSPKLIYYSDALVNMLGGLSAVLGGKCEADFDEALRAKAKVGNSILGGFFRN